MRYSSTSSTGPRTVDIASAPFSDGTAGGLIRFMDLSGVDRSVVCNIATNPGQTDNVNRFAFDTLAAHGDRLTPLGSVNPHCPDPASVLASVKAGGLPGIKIHPDYMVVSYILTKKLTLFHSYIRIWGSKISPA